MVWALRCCFVGMAARPCRFLGVDYAAVKARDAILVPVSSCNE